MQEQNKLPNKNLEVIENSEILPTGNNNLLPIGNRKRKSALTIDEVRNAVMELRANKVKVSTINVKDKLNKGSFRTINNFIRIIESEGVTNSQIEHHQINRELIMKYAQEVVKLAFEGNMKQAESIVKSNNERFEALKEKYIQEISDISSKADDLELTLEDKENKIIELLEQINGSTNEIQRLKNENVNLKQDLAVMTSNYEMSKENIKSKDHEIETLTSALALIKAK